MRCLRHPGVFRSYYNAAIKRDSNSLFFQPAGRQLLVSSGAAPVMFRSSFNFLLSGWRYAPPFLALLRIPYSQV